MVTTLLLFVALAVFQLGLALYVRNTLISAASEGARYGARADSHVGQSVDRTTAIISSNLSAAYADDVTARETTEGGVPVVEVSVSAPVPVLGLLGPAGTMTVSGRAFNERVVGTVAP